MDAAMLTAIGTILLGIGGGAWKLIDRADKKRERREVAVEALLTARIDELKDQLVKQAADFEKERRRLTRKITAAGKWRDQLLVNDIKPDPADWPEDKHDDSE